MCCSKRGPTYSELYPCTALTPKGQQQWQRCGIPPTVPWGCVQIMATESFGVLQPFAWVGEVGQCMGAVLCARQATHVMQGAL